MFVATGLSLLLLTAAMCIRLLWWNSKWQFIETLIKINHKIISYALDGFFGVLDGRENIEHTTDTEIQLQTVTDETDGRKVEGIIQSPLPSVNINTVNILKRS